jgi:ADP-ribose pyrophosphatase
MNFPNTFQAQLPEGLGLKNLSQASLMDAFQQQHLVERELVSESVYRGHFLHVNRDVVSLAGGQQAGREYILHPGAVMIVALLDAQHVVVETQYRYPLKKVMLEFPAGKLDPQEGGLACGRRELAEETGLRARWWARAGHTHNAMAYSNEAIEIWFACGLQAGLQKLDVGEHLEVHSARLSDLEAWVCAGILTDAKTMAGLWWWRMLLQQAWQPQWRDESELIEGC